MSNDKLFWFDLETTGLAPAQGRVLEVGIVVTDTELNIVGRKAWLVEAIGAEEHIGMQAFSGDEGAQIVHEMHKKSGLWEDLKERDRLTHVTELAAEMNAFLDDYGASKADPMCGSSVQFDRNWLDFHFPTVTARLSYRNIDISTLKELCRRLQPAMYSHIDEDLASYQAFPSHRVIPDLLNTINEAGWYFENFLILADD